MTTLKTILRKGRWAWLLPLVVVLGSAGVMGASAPTPGGGHGAVPQQPGGGINPFTLDKMPPPPPNPGPPPKPKPDISIPHPVPPASPIL